MTLLRSLSFRLAVLYALLVAGSAGVLGAVYYWVAIRGPMRSIEHELKTEASALRAFNDARGLEALASRLERRAGAPSPRLAYHALLDAHGRTVTANLPSWPSSPARNWLHIEADVSREGRENEYEALVLDTPLGGGARLLLGRDVEDLEELEDAMRDTALYLLPTLLLLSIIGGAVMSRAIGRRIEAMSGAALQVIEGDLTRRVPVTGARDDFDRLAETLNTMLSRLEGSFQAIQRVSDTVAHELRTPLSRLHAELAEMRAGASAERLERAIGETERLGAIFDAVLRISRIEGRSYGAPKHPVDLGALIEAAVDYYEPAADERAITLDVAVSPGLLVEGDPDLLFQAVGNLLDNAIKYTPSGGAVRVRGKADESGAVLEIADTGPGVAPELHDRITERFFRGPGAERTPGFGLGLSLVAAVARHHRSELRFADAGPGLAIVWHLPAG